MKASKRGFIIFCSTLILFSNLYMCFSIPVYAKPTMDDNGHLHVYNWDDIKDCATDWVMKMAADIGAVFFDHNFAQYVENKEAWVNYWTEDNVKVNEDGTNVTFSADLMAFIKQCLDDYAKEHEPYYMVNTLTLDDMGTSSYTDYKKFYDTAKNLIEDSPSGVVALGAYYSRPAEMYFIDIGHDFKGISPVKAGNDRLVSFYDNETWGQCTYEYYKLTLGTDDEAIKTAEEFKEKATFSKNCGTNYNNPISYQFKTFLAGEVPGIYPYDCRGSHSWLSLITKDRRRIRVFNTYGDFQNYTLGKRSVYYTKEYYSYVPEDLTASVDDLQQSVDGLSGVLDQLLGQITKDTDESEVEDLLQQILDELKNQQGTGGGSGYTNSLLERIHLQLRSIWDEMHKQLEEIKEDFRHVFIFEDAPGINLKYIASLLERILAQLRRLSLESDDDGEKEDDGVFDLDDMLKGILENPETGAKEAADSLSESFGDVAAGLTKKFPISIPWDLYALFSVLADIPSSPVQAAQTVAYDDRGIMLDAAYTQGNIQLLAATPSVTTYRAARASDSPYFELPIYIESYGINETVTVDLDRFKPLSTFSRTLFAIIFGVLLLKWTVAFISAFNEVMPDFFSND